MNTTPISDGEYNTAQVYAQDASGYSLSAVNALSDGNIAFAIEEILRAEKAIRNLKQMIARRK
jgi:hypothetical protein